MRLSLLVVLAVAAAIVGGGCDSSAPAPAPAQRPIRLADLPGRLVFSYRGDVWTARPDGFDRRRLTHGRGPEEDPAWSPDARRIVYRDSRRGFNLNDEIYLMDGRGSGRRNLTRSRWTNDWGPAWSPDGRLIAFNSSTRLHVMRPDGSGLRRVTDIEAEYPAWSPDGGRLAFMSMQPHATGGDPNYDVFVVNLDGSGLRRLTDWPGEDGWPAWSPDGRLIAYTTSQDSEGQFEGGGPYMDVHVMRPDGSGQRRVVHRVWGAYPAWSSDGRFIAFTGSRLSGPDERLWVVRRDGSGQRQLPLPGALPDWTDN